MILTQKRLLWPQRFRISRYFYIAAVAFFLTNEASFSRAYAGHLPNHLNFEILPLTISATHRRGLGLGFSLEKLSLETDTLTAIQSEVSFPFMQKKSNGEIDWNGSMTLMGIVKPTWLIGGKVGVSMLTDDGPTGFVAFSLRFIPRNSDQGYKFFQWVTKQIDLGVSSNNNLYGVVRFGFSLF